ncbi:condensation domain-containing protein [Streptomyces erythrochromogenes]|uniref:condensation domain-containing protein n=1 Tax=Streptomyces erythrochromogenes TaxID=285574 RepID=UPI003448BBA8
MRELQDPPELLRPHPAQLPLLAARRLGNQTANSGRIFRLDGLLDPDRLAAAYRAAAQEHDALRLHLSYGATWQVGAQARIDVRILDRRPSGQSVKATLKAILDDFHQDLGRRYDLARGPIGHITVHRVAERTWVTTEIIDHAVADGRSMKLLFNAVAAIYRGDQYDRPGSFAHALAVQEPDEAAGSYWRGRYADFTPSPPARSLPKPEQAVTRLRLHLTPAQTATLARTARALRVSVPSVLLAAHAHTTARFQGTGDVSIHVAVDTRTDEHLDTFGQFAHVLPLRLAMPWHAHLPEYVRATHRTILEARDHAMVTTDQLHDAGAPTLATPGATAFVMQAVSPPGNRSLPGVTLTPVTADSTPQGTALSTVARTLDDGSTTVELTGGATDPISTALDRWASTFRQFLHALSNDPAALLCSDQLLSPSDCARVQALATPAPHLTSPSLHKAAARQLSRTDRPVIVEGDTGCTGPRLLTLATATAEALQHAGARKGSEVLVGGLRLADRASAWLACLQLGCTYIPYNGDTPPDRPSALRLDPTGVRPSLLPPTAGQDSLSDPPAYVIHTSGSTGRPKGVAVGLAALTNLIHGEQDRFGLDTTSRVLLVAPPTVDPWICHVTTALVLGATLVQGDPVAAVPLAEQLRHHRITHVFLPAGVLRSLDPDVHLPDLKMIASAGDGCRSADLDRFAPARTFNIYGPTEATVTATVHESTPGAGDPAPIGWPIRGLAARVVIDRAATAPPGIPGELALTGAGLAQGYLDQPDLTADAFHPLPGTAGRWYFTGDRAAHTPAGLVHLGRIDRQVKIRGHRVELDALENQATRTGLCTAARALVHRHDDSTQLVLFVEGCPDSKELAARLRQLLPPSHWPHQVHKVGRIPVHPTGKPDDAALAVLASPPAPPTPAQPDGNDTVLGRLWRELLGTTPAPDSHFFQDGGDSLTVLHLLTRLRQAGLHLTPADVYKAPHYPDLQRRLTRDHAQSAPRHASPQFPLTPTGRWMHQLKIPAWRSWILRHSIAFDRMPPAAQLSSALEHLVESTPALRCRSDRRKQFLTVVPPYQPLVVTVAESIPDLELRQTLARAHRAVDPVTGRMLAAAAVQQGDGSGRLVLFGHHLAVDPWSWTVIGRRLALALTGAGLPEDHAYQELAELTEQQTAAGHFDAETGLWRTVLTGGTTAPQDPLVSRPRQTSMALPPLSALTRRWQHSPAVHLLAAAGKALARHNGGRPTVIDLERNGRSHPQLDLSDAVGWFGLHHPVIAPALPTAEAMTHLALDLADVPDHGAGYGALRWSGRVDLGVAVGHIAVDIQDAGTPPDALEHRIQTLAPANPALLTPYPLALTFRAGPEGTTATLNHGCTTSPEQAASILESVNAALSTPEPRTPTRPTGRQQRALRAPAGAMQQMMIHFAAGSPHTGVYLPRQLLHLAVPADEQERFLQRIEQWLDGLDVLHRRFHTETSTGTLTQRWIPDAGPHLQVEPGDVQAARAWMAAPAHLDVQQAGHGAPLAALTAFTSGDGLFLAMETHHALLDGHSNRCFLHQLALVADGNPVPPGPSAAPLLRHLGRETAAGTAVRPVPARTWAPKAPDEHHLVVPSETVRACRARATAQGTNLRACLAALTGQAVALEEGTTLYLVANGRDPQISHADDAWGMLWYFTPVPVLPDGDPAELQKRVYASEAAPLTEIHAAASLWRQWNPRAAVSFNFVAVPRTASSGGRLTVLESRDCFHWPRQITAVLRDDDQVDLMLCTLDGTSAASLLQHAEESLRRYATGRPEQDRSAGL